MGQERVEVMVEKYIKWDGDEDIPDRFGFP